MIIHNKKSIKWQAGFQLLLFFMFYFLLTMKE